MARNSRDNEEIHNSPPKSQSKNFSADKIRKPETAFVWCTISKSRQKFDASMWIVLRAKIISGHSDFQNFRELNFQDVRQKTEQKESASDLQNPGRKNENCNSVKKSFKSDFKNKKQRIDKMKDSFMTILEVSVILPKEVIFKFTR